MEGTSFFLPIKNMLSCIQKCFQITEEGRTYNAVHSCTTLVKMQYFHGKILK